MIRKGIIDFIPCHLSGGGFFKRPKFENFTQVLARSTQWLAEHPQCIYKNAQSLDIKLKSRKCLTHFRNECHFT